VAPPIRRLHASMVGQGRPPVLPQPPCDLLRPLAGEAVDDAGVFGVLRLEKGQELLLRVLLGEDAVADIGPVEAGDEGARLV
jgi:hypothetical protein